MQRLIRDTEFVNFLLFLSPTHKRSFTHMWTLMTQTSLWSVQNSKSMTIPYVIPAKNFGLQSLPLACISRRCTAVRRRSRVQNPTGPATVNLLINSCQPSSKSRPLDGMHLSINWYMDHEI